MHRACAGLIREALTAEQGGRARGDALQGGHRLYLRLSGPQQPSPIRDWRWQPFGAGALQRAEQAQCELIDVQARTARPAQPLQPRPQLSLRRQRLQVGRQGDQPFQK